MKKLNIKYFAVLIILFMVGCEAPTVGYNTYEWGKDFKFSLGTDESIETAMAFNKAWDERDFETMGELSADSIRFYGGDGILRNLDWVKEASLRRDSVRAANGATLDTELKHVYSLVINPESGYEIVKTHFVYTFKDSLENVNNWRQFETFIVKDGKIERWSGSGQDIVEETE